MTKEEMKAMIKDCVYLEDGITYMSDKQYNNYINIIKQLQKENKQLKKQLEEYKLITIDYQELELRNQKLKEQVEEYKRLGFEHLNDKCNKLENQQKEFIKYLTSYIELLSNDPDFFDECQKDILEEILSKYEEIIEK